MRHDIRHTSPRARSLWHRLGLRGRFNPAHLSARLGRVHFDRFRRIKATTGGMLPASVYRRIHDSVRACADLDIVEIGGASGAASIAIALGMDAARMRSSLVVVEKFQGGSRDRIGDRDANLQLFERNLRRYGVWDRVRLFPTGMNAAKRDELLALVHTDRIGAMMLDADGRIDRDFSILAPRLAPGATIIIDDYEDTDQYKQRLTERLTDQFIDWGLLEPMELVGNTLFATWPPDADCGRLDLERCREILNRTRLEFGRDPEPRPSLDPGAAK